MNEQKFTRRETFLKKIAGYSVDKLPEPLTREEVYLKKIAENGTGGSGGADLSDYAQKEEVAQAIESAHTHTNKATLDNITDEKVASWESAVQQIGDIQTALAAIVEVEA